MNKFKSSLQAIDSFQQSRTFLAFPVAVIKRYGDEQAGKQAALVTYYAFLSLFPLIMIFITVLGIVVSNNPALEAQIMRSVFQFFPSLSTELKSQVHTLKSSGIGLLLQTLVVLYGARGFASILQETFNNLWGIPKENRPGLLGDALRSFGMMASVAFGMLIGATISYILTSYLRLGIIGAVLVTILNAFITFGLFLTVFRLGTSSRIGLRQLVAGAAIAAIGTLTVQRFGVYIMGHQLPKLQGSYGSFALALGMLFWIYLQAQIILYALVITIVRTERDWPKKLF